MEPRLEALGVPQGANFAPGGQQRRLDGVVSKVEVAQDPERDRHASVAGQARQGIEGLSIASLRLLHQLCVHPSLRAEVLVAPDLSAIGLESLGGSLSVHSGLRQAVDARRPSSPRRASVPGRQRCRERCRLGERPRLRRRRSHADVRRSARRLEDRDRPSTCRIHARAIVPRGLGRPAHRIGSASTPSEAKVLRRIGRRAVLGPQFQRSQGPPDPHLSGSDRDRSSSDARSEIQYPRPSVDVDRLGGVGDAWARSVADDLVHGGRRASAAQSAPVAGDLPSTIRSSGLDVADRLRGDGQDRWAVSVRVVQAVRSDLTQSSRVDGPS